MIIIIIIVILIITDDDCLFVFMQTLMNVWRDLLTVHSAVRTYQELLSVSVQEDSNCLQMDSTVKVNNKFHLVLLIHLTYLYPGIHQ